MELALSYVVGFIPCGFELRDDGTAKFIPAPNLTLTYVRPDQVVEIVQLDYKLEHKVGCTLLMFVNGSQRMVIGDVEEVRKKLRRGAGFKDDEQPRGPSDGAPAGNGGEVPGPNSPVDGTRP